MADPGAGTKFVPVNLNRSYGRHSKVSSSNLPGSRYGPARPRPGGGGGSMLVLSRSHSSQKATGPKLSVPPPLNLPSLRKEHQRFDSSGSTTGVVAPPGVGQRPGSSGVGWTKPAPILAPLEGEQASGDNVGVDSVVAKGSGTIGGAYVPPSARPVVLANSSPSQGYSVPVVEKVTVLRGEDFPSLKATLPSPNPAMEKKQKDGAVQKQKLVSVEEMPTGLRDGSKSSVLMDMRPHVQSRSNDLRNGRDGDGKQNCCSGGGMVEVERDGKQEDYSPGLLPWVQMNPRSDWEDDERDTGHTLIDRGRYQGFPKSEAYWERDFDFPRPSILPQKPTHNLFERLGLPGSSTARMSPGDMNKSDTNGKHVAAPGRDGREGNSWKASSSLSKEGYRIHETGYEGDVTGGRPSSKKNERIDNTSSAFQDHFCDDSGRRDIVYNQGGTQPWNGKMHSSVGQGLERNSRERNSREYYGGEQHNRRKGEHFQNNFGLKSSSSSPGGKMLAVYDPVINFGRDKHISSKSGKHYVEDPFVKDSWTSDFDGGDPFSVGLVGLVKKKKEVFRQTEFHDPVRESFEAELERVQKMQEIERQRNLEEKERAMELPRKEEEERMRLAREQEEQQRQLEEEAQEAAQRAEQQRLEVMQRAEEQRVAREEEKRKMLMEEERRKQAARQKLLELEERIAKRQAEAASSVTGSSGFTDEKSSGMAFQKDVLKVLDMVDWEDGERTLERIITSASSDLSMINRPFEVGSKHGTSVVLDRGKAMQSWKKEAQDVGNHSTFFRQYQENEFHSPKWDASVGGRPFPGRKYQGGPGLTPFGAYQKEGNSDPLMDELGPSKSQRWNITQRGEYYTRTLDMELQDNLEDRYGEPGWEQDHPHENIYPPHRERMHRNPEDEEMYSFERARFSMRQPRVLPPPSFSSTNRFPVRSEQPGSSSFSANEVQNSHGVGNEPALQTKLDGRLWESTLEDVQRQSTEFEGQKLDGGSARCDSPSSFSVSSPPDTPAQLSHDDLEESGDSPVLLSAKRNLYVEGKDCMVLPSEAVKATVLRSGVVSTAEEEEEEWPVDNNVELQEQEEYDEDGSYEEEDGVHDGEDENVKLGHELDGEIFEGNASPVLCFNEGVEVRMPNDELEGSLRNEQNNVGLPEVSTSTREEPISFDGFCRNEATLPAVDGYAPASDDASRVLLETQNPARDLSIEHEAASQMSTKLELSNQVGTPESAVLPNQFQMPSLSSEGVQGAAAVSTQPEVPINLQFGLFSGPPLIPSPVPAIQIGSIQMPLHLHSPIGPSFSNMHQLQPPLFHFGQLRYTSPISPEILPLSPQSVHYVQPTAPAHMNVSNNLESKNGTVIPPRESANDSTKLQHSSRDLSHGADSRSAPEMGIQVEDSSVKNLDTSPATESADQQIFGSVSSLPAPKRGNFGMSKNQGLSSGGRGRRYITTPKSGSRSLLPTPDASRLDAGEFHKRSRRQRTEFRVRENPRRMHGSTSSYLYEVNDRSSSIVRSGGTRSTVRQMSNRQARQTFELQGSNLQPVSSLGSDAKVGEKESSKNSHSLSYSGEHVDASFQGGIGCIVDKPGIETPSDNDDFIEVRSRRQMLNERRAQREKEIKAKSRVPKIPRKLHSTSRVVASASKASAVAAVPNNVSSDGISAERRSLRALETSAGIKSPPVSQPLPPIGTPAVKSDVSVKADKNSQQIRSTQTSSLVSDDGKSLTSESVYDSGDKLLADVQISTGSLGNSHVTQQVMALTQTQLDEAMQPAHFDSRSTVGDSKNKVGERSLPPASTMKHDKSFTSAASAINSSLSGERIQFAEGCCSLFFEKEKNVDQSSMPSQGCEAEAEAAASAVVAAISSDENRLANGSLSVNSSCSGGGANIDGMAAEAGSCNQQSQVRPDEPLNITLPADLSVETPPIPLWPPLSSPQNASSPMLSHVPGGLPGRFPFYEMNPLMEGHMFAFGRPEESASSQSQAQQNNAILSAPLGTWQHHSSIDPVYGPPAGFAGPFIGPPGSVPGVQSPAHMVVYNHLAPVGQFGQVGLSFVGTRYVPSGKQTDWNHITASTASVVREGDMDSTSMVSAQLNPSKMPASLQHIAPLPPLLPMNSPVAMFDVSPLQSCPEMTSQTRWLHVPAAPLQSVHASMPLQHQALPSVKHRPSINQQSAASGFVQSQSETPSDNSGDYAVTTDATITQLPDELGLLNSIPVGAATSAQSLATKSSSATSTQDASKKDTVQNGSESKTSGRNMNDSLKIQTSQKNPSAQHHSSSSGYNNQRDGISQKNNTSGGERIHRRSGYQGRNHSLATEKNFPQSKTKQIYVAKPSSSGTSTAS